MTDVAVVDYGAGNLTSVLRGLRRAGLDAAIVSDPALLGRARGILVPGVGHFAATSALGDDWHAALLARARAGVPLLGICLGMQFLFDGSAEAPGLRGLGLTPGSCQRLGRTNDTGSRFPETTPGVISSGKVPHLGWNRLAPTGASRLLNGIEPGAFAYFAHSFAAPITRDTVATTQHIDTFASVIERDNIFGAQFHPELSSAVGARIFTNFAQIVTQ